MEKIIVKHDLGKNNQGLVIFDSRFPTENSRYILYDCNKAIRWHGKIRIKNEEEIQGYFDFINSENIICYLSSNEVLQL